MLDNTDITTDTNTSTPDKAADLRRLYRIIGIVLISAGVLCFACGCYGVIRMLSLAESLREFGFTQSPDRVVSFIINNGLGDLFDLSQLSVFLISNWQNAVYIGLGLVMLGYQFFMAVKEKPCFGQAAMLLMISLVYVMLAQGSPDGRGRFIIVSIASAILCVLASTRTIERLLTRFSHRGFLNSIKTNTVRLRNRFRTKKISKKSIIVVSVVLAALGVLTLMVINEIQVSKEARLYVYDTDDNRDAIVKGGPERESLEIPSKLFGYKVTKIGEYAFSSSQDLVTVSIPNTVKKIGDGAFSFCDNLTSLNIPNSVTDIGDNPFRGSDMLSLNISPDHPVFQSVDDVLYDKDKDLLVAYMSSKSEDSYAIAQGTQVIGGAAFADSHSLAGVTIPDSVASIRNDAFINCDSLKSVTLPDSVGAIGDRAFSDCDSLASVKLNDGLEIIGQEAFLNCDSLVSVVIPDSVSSIGKNAFADCDSLTLIVKRDSYADKYAMRNDVPYSYSENINSETIRTATGAPAVFEDQGYGYMLDEMGHAIVISRSDNIDNVTLPQTLDDRIVAGIGERLFSNHTGLIGVILPETLTSIASRAFYNCSELVYITIPDGVTNIGDNTFAKCSNLGSVEIPDSVTSIGDYAFSECGSLIDVTLSNNLISIGDYAFSECERLDGLTLPESLTSIGDSAFLGCKRLSGITIPGDVAKLGDRVFEECRSMISAEISYGVTAISKEMFFNCDRLKHITIPDSVTSIGPLAFVNCKELDKITIPNSVTSIDNEAFCGTSIGVLRIPNSVKSLGRNPFHSIKKLKFDVAPNHPSFSLIDGVLFDKTQRKLLCYPQSLHNETYTIPPGTTEIEDRAFYSSPYLKSVTIPNGVTILNHGSFDYCRNLESVTIPDSVTIIGEHAFSDCKSLKRITIPESVTSIGDRAFENCSSLEEIVLPNDLVHMGVDVFKGCGELETTTKS